MKKLEIVVGKTQEEIQSIINDDIIETFKNSTQGVEGNVYISQPSNSGVALAAGRDIIAKR